MYKTFGLAKEPLVRAVLLRLVQPGFDTGDTRRRALLSELAIIDVAGEDVVERLIRGRLLVSGWDEAKEERTVEIAHEALLEHWSTLAGWINADREFLLWRDRLGAALKQWEETGHDRGSLLRGASLSEAQNWLLRSDNTPSERERESLPFSERAWRRAND